jgi:hypothetical protein
MDKFLQAIGYYTVEILQKMALVQAVWIGSPLGTATAPYFAKAPEVVEQAAKSVKAAPKCINLDGRRVCEK